MMIMMGNLFIIIMKFEENCIVRVMDDEDRNFYFCFFVRVLLSILLHLQSKSTPLCFYTYTFYLRRRFVLSLDVNVRVA